MSIKEIYNNIIATKIINEIDGNISNFTTDTRKVKENSCYIGIVGENTDGNDFYMEAFKNGAILVILDKYIEKEEDINYLKENNKSIIIVKDAIKSLGNLAKYKRSIFKNDVIAITGSAGKTSTKDIVYSVLKEKYKTHKTIGNKNNHIGLPLTILNMNEEADILVLEMGMNHFKEISYLTNIAKPNIAIITNIGTAHIGNLGSQENILKAKLEILEGLDSNGYLIINNDNELLHKWYLENKDNYKIITIGIDNESDYTAKKINCNPNDCEFRCLNELYKIPIGGKHFIYNALMGIAVGKKYNESYQEISTGIMNFELSSNRMNIINRESNITIIDDSYNANYDSMSYAIKYLSGLNGRRIAVLGSMLELGKYSEELHQKIGNEVYEEGIDLLITIGEEAKYINIAAIKKGFNKNLAYHYENIDEAIRFLKDNIKSDDKILIKASNSMNFKKIVDALN